MSVGELLNWRKTRDFRVPRSVAPWDGYFSSSGILSLFSFGPVLNYKLVAGSRWAGRCGEYSAQASSRLPIGSTLHPDRGSQLLIREIYESYRD